MRRSIEIIYEGDLDPEVLTYLTKDLGLLVEETRPLVVRSTNTYRDIPAVLGAARLIPGVKRVLVRAGSATETLTALDAGYSR
jgi:hypothetical protein